MDLSNISSFYPDSIDIFTWCELKFRESIAVVMQIRFKSNEEKFDCLF